MTISIRELIDPRLQRADRRTQMWDPSGEKQQLVSFLRSAGENWPRFNQPLA